MAGFTSVRFNSPCLCQRVKTPVWAARRIGVEAHGPAGAVWQVGVGGCPSGCEVE